MSCSEAQTDAPPAPTVVAAAAMQTEPEQPAPPPPPALVDVAETQTEIIAWGEDGTTQANGDEDTGAMGTQLAAEAASAEEMAVQTEPDEAAIAAEAQRATDREAEVCGENREGAAGSCSAIHSCHFASTHIGV